MLRITCLDTYRHMTLGTCVVGTLPPRPRPGLHPLGRVKVFAHDAPRGDCRLPGALPLPPRSSAPTSGSCLARQEWSRLLERVRSVHRERLLSHADAPCVKLCLTHSQPLSSWHCLAAAMKSHCCVVVGAASRHPRNDDPFTTYAHDYPKQVTSFFTGERGWARPGQSVE
jgi:hypothetical protein